MGTPYKDKLIWLDKNRATLKDNPNVELIFAEKAEEGIVDRILAMLMRNPAKAPQFDDPENVPDTGTIR